MKTMIRTIAMYLPQYHPFKENDEWWGKGFTEWNNVVKCKPRFRGHYQPHLPADLGFYDLRNPETRQEQVILAKQYGITGFCYYHYWFNGKQLMERPVNEILTSGAPDFPFCLCWANENWSRRWDGSEDKILIAQNYSEEDDINHIRYLLSNVFRDKRYICVDGKPVFIIYKPDLFPNIGHTIQVWREEAKKEGMELYLCSFERSNGMSAEDACAVGFDAAIEFQPLSKSMRLYLQKHKSSILKRAIRKIRKIWCQRWHQEIRREDRIIDYSKFVDFDLQQPVRTCKCFPGASPSWDNSSRREKIWATIFKNSTPYLFEKWCRGKLQKFVPYSEEENFFFINAWNEWAEGNHLEPDQKWGRLYLEAFSRALSNNSGNKE